ARVRTFDSVSTATGEVVGTFPADGPERVAAAVARAREAQAGWDGLGFEGRRRALLAYKALLVRRTDELVALVHRENGKPNADALIEVVMVAEHLNWAARNAARVLGPRRARPTLVLANHTPTVEYQRRGGGPRAAPAPPHPGSGHPHGHGRVPAPRGGRGPRPLELPGLYPARVGRLRPGRRHRARC